MTPTPEEMQQADAAKAQMMAAARQAMADHGFGVCPSAIALMLIGVILDLAHEDSGQRADIGIEMVRSGFAVLGVNADVSILRAAASFPETHTTRH